MVMRVLSRPNESEQMFFYSLSNVYLGYTESTLNEMREYTSEQASISIAIEAAAPHFMKRHKNNSNNNNNKSISTMYYYIAGTDSFHVSIVACQFLFNESKRNSIVFPLLLYIQFEFKFECVSTQSIRASQIRLYSKNGILIRINTQIELFLVR